ncbi:unnamed protein product [Ixodes persulcatus]
MCPISSRTLSLCSYLVQPTSAHRQICFSTPEQAGMILRAVRRRQICKPLLFTVDQIQKSIYPTLHRTGGMVRRMFTPRAASRLVYKAAWTAGHPRHSHGKRAFTSVAFAPTPAVTRRTLPATKGGTQGRNPSAATSARRRLARTLTDWSTKGVIQARNLSGARSARRRLCRSPTCCGTNRFTPGAESRTSVERAGKRSCSDTPCWTTRGFTMEIGRTCARCADEHTHGAAI